jgi:plastocyanin domain-containing protein
LYSQYLNASLDGGGVGVAKAAGAAAAAVVKEEARRRGRRTRRKSCVPLALSGIMALVLFLFFVFDKREKDVRTERREERGERETPARQGYECEAVKRRAAQRSRDTSGRESDRDRRKTDERAEEKVKGKAFWRGG